jgi:ABC-type sugar transport system ATPase subunit
MNDSEEYIIRTQGLGKSYKEVEALKSMDLKVPGK